MDEVQEPSPAPLDVRLTEESGAPAVVLAGELDISNVGKLRSTLEQLPADAEGPLVFETEALRYMDSSGLSVLLEAATRGRTVVLKNPNTTIRRLIEVTGLTGVVQLEPED